MAKDFTVTRPSPKWVLNKDGELVQFADNFPSFEFNSDGSYKGVLAEPQSVNLCLWSEDFRDTTTWSYGFQGNDVKATQTTTPDGDSTSKYIKLSDNGGGNTGGIFVGQTISVSANTKYTASVFAKADGLSHIFLQATDYDGSSDAYRFFGLSGAGSLGTATGLDDSKIEAYPNGWYRCSITWTQGVSDNSFIFRIYGASSNSNGSVPLNNTSSVFIWGAQVEKGPIATSYIKTTNETQTRNEDVITMSDASQYIPSEGAVIMEWEQREADTIYIGALSASVNAGVRKLRFEYSSTEQKLFIDDVEENSLTGDFDFSGMDKIELGHINGADQPNTHIRYFAIV